ncbi:MAG: hypothetical protein ACRD0O_18280, partial [Acidimicrobiia bacterium]
MSNAFFSVAGRGRIVSGPPDGSPICTPHQLQYAHWYYYRRLQPERVSLSTMANRLAEAVTAYRRAQAELATAQAA